MMKKILISFVAILCAYVSFGQDKTVQELKNEAARDIQKDPNDTIPKIWKKGGLLTLTFNQASQSNWAAGGDKNSLALSGIFHGFAFYKKDRNSWDNTLDLAYGFVRTTSLGTRKSDDRIDVLSKYGYELTKNWYVGALVNVKSQFAPGYAYPADGGHVLTSDFFAPGYILLSPGINYKPNDQFSVFVSPATARWIIVRNDSLASVGAFGVDSGKNSKLEVGAYATINYTHKVGKMAVYTGRLDLFSNYEHKPQNVDVSMTNLLAVKVSGILTMTFALNLIYDDDVKTVKDDGTPGGAALQLQEILGIGIALKL
ncbi:MAG TPA: DUF3078 domain-containing protein [Puia sp.]|nr:DUF3078 domain-containing protein [Puia sp.]